MFSFSKAILVITDNDGRYVGRYVGRLSLSGKACLSARASRRYGGYTKLAAVPVPVPWSFFEIMLKGGSLVSLSFARSEEL